MPENNVAMGLVAFGAALLLSAGVLSFTDSAHATSLYASTATRPTIIRGAPTFTRSNVAVNGQAPGAEEEVAQIAMGAVGAAAVGMVGATAETQHIIPLPLAATGLSLALLAFASFVYTQFKITAFGTDEEMGESIAMMSTSGTGVVKGEQLFTVDKPIGMTLEAGNGGQGVKVGFVNPMGNAGKAGIKPGDTIIYTSSFFGDELWPADKVGFTRSAIQACPTAIDFVVLRGAAADSVNVKRLPKRPAPPKFGRKLSAAEKARASHICIDCGYIYTQPKAFADLPSSYRCPQCQATKKRFTEYDAETGKYKKGAELPVGTLAGVALGVGLIGFLGYIAIAL